MKKLNIIFIVICALIFISGAAHTAYAYVSIANDPFTGMPASVAFFLVIPYCAALAFCGVLRFVLGKCLH